MSSSGDKKDEEVATGCLSACVISFLLLAFIYLILGLLNAIKGEINELL